MDKANIRAASNEKINELSNIARDFLKTIFQLELEDCFISDKTKLLDLLGCESDEYYYEKIKEHYNINNFDINKAYLIDILSEIDKRKEISV